MTRSESQGVVSTAEQRWEDLGRQNRPTIDVVASVAGRMTERELMALVTRLAQLLGWCVYHQFDSRHSRAGWPDLFLLHPGNTERGRAIAIELKRERGRVTPAQAHTLALLALAGIPAYVMRPSDWLSGRIERALRGDGDLSSGR